MTTLGIFVRLEAKSGNPLGYIGSMRVTAAKLKYAKSSHMSAVWHLARFLAASFCSRVSVRYGLLFAVGYKFHALSHFLNCHGPRQGVAFALHFHVPRNCLQCA